MCCHVCVMSSLSPVFPCRPGLVALGVRSLAAAHLLLGACTLVCVPPGICEVEALLARSG